MRVVFFFGFFLRQNCKPSVIGSGVGDWLKTLTKLDFYETGEVSVPMICQKIIAKKGEWIDRISELAKLPFRVVPEDGTSVTFRGCQLDGGKTDVCEPITKSAKKEGVTIEKCEICKEDGCNKSPSHHIINLWLLIIPLVLIRAFV